MDIIVNGARGRMGQEVCRHDLRVCRMIRYYQYFAGAC